MTVPIITRLRDSSKQTRHSTNPDHVAFYAIAPVLVEEIPAGGAVFGTHKRVLLAIGRQVHQASKSTGAACISFFLSWTSTKKYRQTCTAPRGAHTRPPPTLLLRARARTSKSTSQPRTRSVPAARYFCPPAHELRRAPHTHAPHRRRAHKFAPLPLYASFACRNAGRRCHLGGAASGHHRLAH